MRPAAEPRRTGADSWLAHILPSAALDKLAAEPAWTPQVARTAIVNVLAEAESPTANEACDVTSAAAVKAAQHDTSRDARARRELASGELELQVLANEEALLGQLEPSAKEKLLQRLVGVRNLFGRGLVSMPRSYITRVVFDVQHKTLALIKQGEVRGGEVDVR